jgi:hypothetical protein
MKSSRAPSIGFTSIEDAPNSSNCSRSGDHAGHVTPVADGRPVSANAIRSLVIVSDN